MRVKLVPLEAVQELMEVSCKEYNLERKESQIIDALIAAFPTAVIHQNKYVLHEDVRLFMDNWVRALKSKDFNFLTMKRGKRWELPTDYEKILESPEYLNQANQVRPAIKREFLRLYENGAYYPEVILTGATGIGKDYFSYLIYAVTLMELYSYWNPQIEFGLAAGTSIVLAIQSLNKELAKQVTFNELVGTVLINSKFFRETFSWDKTVTTELRFPGNIYVRPFTGEDTAALGMAIFSAIANEANFMSVVSKSKKTGGQEFNQAERIYRTLTRRIAGRFNQFGQVPGKMILISSANKEGDFIHRKLQEVEAMPPEEKAKVFIMSMSQLDAFAGMDRLLPGTFLVEKGDETKQSRILDTRDDAINPEDVIEVPMDYIKFFRDDIDGALADIAGEFVSRGKRKFIPYREAIAASVAAHMSLNDGEQLFLQDEIIFDMIVDPDNPDYTKIVNMDYINRMFTRDLAHSGHIDYGFVEDATGVAIVNIQSYKLVDKTNVWNPKTRSYDSMSKVNLPVYCVEGALGIKASSGSEVDISFVEGLFCFLKQHINIMWLSFDSYESRSSRQTLSKLGMITGVVSTVSDVEPYTELKAAIRTGRILLPNNNVLLKEIRELERLPNGKVDHQAGGSKDIADAVAACIYVLNKQALRGRQGNSRSHKASDGDTTNRSARTSTVRRSRFSSV